MKRFDISEEAVLRELATREENVNAVAMDGADAEYHLEVARRAAEDPRPFVRRLFVLGACTRGLEHAMRFPTFREAWDACVSSSHMVWCVDMSEVNGRYYVPVDSPDRLRAKYPTVIDVFDAPETEDAS